MEALNNKNCIFNYYSRFSLFLLFFYSLYTIWLFHKFENDNDWLELSAMKYRLNKAKYIICDLAICVWSPVRSTTY